MDITKFKVVEKDKFELAVQKATDEIWENDKINKAFLLGEITILKSMLESVGKFESLDKEYIKDCIKIITEGHEWTKEIVKAINF